MPNERLLCHDTERDGQDNQMSYNSMTHDMALRRSWSFFLLISSPSIEILPVICCVDLYKANSIVDLPEPDLRRGAGILCQHQSGYDINGTGRLTCHKCPTFDRLPE